MELPSITIKGIKSLLKRKPPRIGIDIEGHSARIVRLDRNEDGDLVLGAFAEVKFDFSAPVDALSEFQIAAKRIAKGNFKVAVSIDHPTLRIRRMVLPKMPDADLLQAIKWNFREHVEITMDKYTVGYVPLVSDKEENKVSLIAFGVAEEIITEYMIKFKLLGLKPVSIEPVSSALLASLKMNGVLDDGLHHVAISFGRAITNFVVYKDNELLFSRPLAGISTDALIKKIGRDLAMSEKDSAEMVQNWMFPVVKEGVPPAEPIPMFLATVRHFFSQVVIEVQRSIDAFSLLYGIDKIDKIHVCGYGVRYPMMIDHIEKTLAIPTTVFDPFEKILDKTMGAAGSPADAPLYAVAVGLAIP